MTGREKYEVFAAEMSATYTMPAWEELPADLQRMWEVEPSTGDFPGKTTLALLTRIGGLR